MYNDLFEQLNLQTGDILLFSSHYSFIDIILKFFTFSRFTHIGIILKDPIYINENLTGYYLLHSGFETEPDAEDHKRKYGVQITDLNFIFKEALEKNTARLFVRKLKAERDDAFHAKIKDIHDKVYNKPYDIHPLDWIIAELELQTNDELPLIHGHHKDRFWCSALVAYAYVQLDYLDKHIPWSFIAPNQFSSNDKHKLSFHCELDNDQEVALT